MTRVLAAVSTNHWLSANEPLRFISASNRQVTCIDGVSIRQWPFVTKQLSDGNAETGKRLAMLTMAARWLTIAITIQAVWCWSPPSWQQPAQGANTRRLRLTHDLFGLHKNLTEIESITGNERHVGERLLRSLASQGYNTEKQILGEDPLRFNILAWPGNTRNARLLLSSHIDTVSMTIRGSDCGLCLAGTTLLSLQALIDKSDHLRSWLCGCQRQCSYANHSCEWPHLDTITQSR